MPSIRVRLSAMMFIQYLGMGVFMPLMGHYLKGYLLFAPFNVGVILAMPAVAAFVSPLLVAYVADRWIRAERLLAFCQFLASGAMLLVWLQTAYVPFLFTYLVFWLFFMPTLALTNTVAFHHLADARREFGPVRMWGTVAWVVVGFTYGLLWLRRGDVTAGTSRLPDGLLFSAAAFALMGLYALTLPVVATESTRDGRVSPWRSVAVLTRPSLAVLCLITFLTALLNMFYITWMSPYLSQIGFSDGWILPLLSIGQMSEIVVMGILGRFLARLGLKGTLLLGLLMQVVRFAVFSSTVSTPWIAGAIALHGLTYACFFTAAFIYVDNHCRREERAGAQLLFNSIITGAGSLSGSLVAGAFAQHFTINGTSQIDYSGFWFVPGAMAVGTASLTAFLFREEPGPAVPGGQA